MSNKIDLDKYYTPSDIVDKCIQTTREVLRGKKVSEIIEPSAGNGAFSLKFPQHLVKAYDIEPEHESILKQDYLELDLPYKENRLIIGNPPFGSRLNLAQKFFKKSVELGDFIAFVLPISQLWNTNSLFEFDLIYSEDLGKQYYTDRNLHCCFNIYKRPEKGLNSRPKNKLKNINIVRQDSKNYDLVDDFDIRMCYWGNGSAGKILKEGENYSAEYKISVKQPFKEKVKEVLTNINWFDELNCIAMLKIQQFHIVRVLKKYVPNIE